MGKIVELSHDEKSMVVFNTTKEYKKDFYKIYYDITEKSLEEYLIDFDKRYEEFKGEVK